MPAIDVRLATKTEHRWAQRQVTEHHYLYAPVDSRCSPLTYVVTLPSEEEAIGCLIFGRPESTRCYRGTLTYGSIDDVASGIAEFSRWELLNLARVWLSPEVQPGGCLHAAAFLPGFTDRKGVFRSKLASTAIRQALELVVLEYLLARPPCFLDEPYQIVRVLSYCDTRLHRGTIYREAGFQLAQTNADGIQTWVKRVRRLEPDEDLQVQSASLRSSRAQKYRAARSVSQSTMEFV